MTDWVKRALTRRAQRRGPKGKYEEFEIEPRDELIYGVKFAVGMTACLSAVEIAYIAFLHSWNNEIFSAMTGLTGLITGILIGHHS